MSTGNKRVLRYEAIRARMLEGLNTFADPIRETLSPKGRNVLFQTEGGETRSTNDGATIAKNIHLKDEVQNAVIELVRGASLKTNTEVGDGTSTSILLSQVLIQEGFKCIDAGWKPMAIKKWIEDMGEILIATLKGKAVKATTDKHLLNVARVSANNDETIAKDVLKVIKVVGEDGMVFLDLNNKPTTEIIKDTGFLMDVGLFVPELRNNPKTFSAGYTNVPVLITDKRLYYEAEAEHILETVLLAGYKSVVIVARDFIGQSVNTFIANHTKGTCNVLMVKAPDVTEKDAEVLHDLAAYLGGRVITDKEGSLVDKLTIGDFVLCDRAFADGRKTIISTAKKTRNRALIDRVAALRKELEKDKHDEALKKRIASMTNGMVTIRVGAATQIETIERMYRYEDAVHATRAALTDGYLIGGGVTLLSLFETFKPKMPVDAGGMALIERFCAASIAQIAQNCDEHVPSVLEEIRRGNRGQKIWKYGYNAATGEFENLERAGVLDAYRVTEMAIANSVSVASQILSSNFLIVHDTDEASDKKHE